LIVAERRPPRTLGELRTCLAAVWSNGLVRGHLLGSVPQRRHLEHAVRTLLGDPGGNLTAESVDGLVSWLVAERSLSEATACGLALSRAADLLRPATAGGTPTTHAGATPAEPPPPARHSEDFRFVHWFGSDHLFTASQSACVKVLWRNWENRTPDVGEGTILTDVEVDAEAKRLIDLFRDRASSTGRHPAWGTMIGSRQKGAYRLVEPETS
jgi:hypothetical protein